MVTRWLPTPELGVRISGGPPNYALVVLTCMVHGPKTLPLRQYSRLQSWRALQTKEGRIGVLMRFEPVEVRNGVGVQLSPLPPD